MVPFAVEGGGAGGGGGEGAVRGVEFVVADVIVFAAVGEVVEAFEGAGVVGAGEGDEVVEEVVGEVGGGFDGGGVGERRLEGCVVGCCGWVGEEVVDGVGGGEVCVGWCACGHSALWGVFRGLRV